ncbi:MAG: bifunctional phosphopantothenoylcysteine decarboxylase/phosphopantothenate--cysteine ligase CoaBC [Nitrospinota bacterium]
MRLEGKFVVLGVTGGIAAYKAAELLRFFVKAGAETQVVMTANAQNFIAPLTFQVLSQRPVVTRMFPMEGGDAAGEMPHIGLAERASLIVIAPATANIIAKFALGLADDFLSTLLLSARCPVLLAPAMNTHMWENPTFQENLEKLKSRGVLVVGPEEGPLATEVEGRGRGRLAEPESIFRRAEAILLAGDDLKGLRLLVTAGPTREAWDAIRFISNRSSGRMGYALAARASERGAEVTLLSGPTSLEPPSGVKFIGVESALEMREALLRELPRAHALIKAAAVSDFRPKQSLPQKLKKSEGPLTLELEPTPDILREVGERKGKLILVGFAAESEDLLKNAKKKLREKNLDLIVANPVGGEDSAMGSEKASALIITAEGEVTELPTQSKEELADEVLSRLKLLWEKASPS